MGALIPLALTIAPEIARWLFGDNGQKTASAVSAAVQAVTGSSEAEAAATVLAGNPQATTRLRLQLAQLAAEQEQAARADDLATLTATLKDASDARAQTVALAGQRSTIAYGAPVVSVVVLITFGCVMTMALTRSIPVGSEAILNVLLGTLAAMATSVVSYWVGSSAGSARKDERLAQAGK